jgi:hypothetical protein
MRFEDLDVQAIPDNRADQFDEIPKLLDNPRLKRA